MSLIYCRNCGAKISDKAPVCPACGVPTNPQPTPQPTPPLTTGKGIVYARNILFFLYALIGVVALFSLLSINAGADMAKVAEEAQEYYSDSESQKMSAALRSVASPLVTGYWIILISSIAGIVLTKMYGRSLKIAVIVSFVGYVISVITILSILGGDKSALPYLRVGYEIAFYAWLVCSLIAVLSPTVLLIDPDTKLSKIIILAPFVFIGAFIILYFLLGSVIGSLLV